MPPLEVILVELFFTTKKKMKERRKSIENIHLLNKLPIYLNGKDSNDILLK